MVTVNSRKIENLRLQCAWSGEVTVKNSNTRLHRPWRSTALYLRVCPCKNRKKFLPHYAPNWDLVVTVNSPWHWFHCHGNLSLLCIRWWEWRHFITNTSELCCSREKVVEPMGKTSLVLDMVDVQEHDCGYRWNKFLSRRTKTISTSFRPEASSGRERPFPTWWSLPSLPDEASGWNDVEIVFVLPVIVLKNLLCIDRAATIQTYHLSKTFSKFRFPFTTVRRAPSDECIRPSRRIIDCSTSKQSS